MFPYIGGKAHHVKWLDPLFPDDSSTFVEVFGGAGWVSIKSNKVNCIPNRIYNDYNPLLANVFYCFSRHTTDLLAALKHLTKSDYELYRKFQQELFNDLDLSSITLGNIDLAAKYLYLQTQIFAGTPLSIKNVPYFVDVKTSGKYPSKYDTLINKLSKPNIVDRLNKISTVECMDCCDVIERYDSIDTFFYVDPPYYNKEFYYSKSFPKDKHKQLADQLSNISGKFALSYYNFDDLKVLYPEDRYRWHHQEVYRSAATRSSSNTNYSNSSKGVEVVIMNY